MMEEVDCVPPRVSDPPIFIVGLPRSGSTLWLKVIAAHPDIAAFNEMHYLSPWHRDFRHVLRSNGDLARDANVSRLVRRLFSEPPPAGLRHGPYFWRALRKLRDAQLPEAVEARLLASPDRSLGTIFRLLIEEATRCRDAARAAVKFPVHPVYMDRLVEWWPEARVVHISRDPRSLAASKTSDPGGTVRLTARHPWMRNALPYAGMSFATFQYIWTSRVHRRIQGHPNYALFLYEDLLSNPRAAVERLCRFCGLEFQASMLDPAAGQASSVTGNKARGFDAARIHGWQSVLAPWQSRLITGLTRPSMKRFGYSPWKTRRNGGLSP